MFSLKKIFIKNLITGYTALPPCGYVRNNYWHGNKGRHLQDNHPIVNNVLRIKIRILVTIIQYVTRALVSCI